MSAAAVDCAIEIDRSPEDVFDYVTDIGREFEWNPRTKRVVKLTDGPIGAGTRWEGEWVAGDPMLIEYVAFDRPTSWRSIGRSRGLLGRERGARRGVARRHPPQPPGRARAARPAAIARAASRPDHARPGAPERRRDQGATRAWRNSERR
jgi:hypothetical protein